MVVPVHRNAATVGELADRVAGALAPTGRDFELLFVDDACPDGSTEALAQIAARDRRVRVHSLPRNIGQHRAVLHGLSQARGEWCVILDADLQDPPEAIPRLLEVGESGYAAVFAGRRGRYESRARLLTSRFFKRTLALLAGVPVDAGMFVALDRELVRRLLAMPGRRPFMVGMIGYAGLPSASVPVARVRRAQGYSSYDPRLRASSAARGLAWGLRAAARRAL